MNNICKRIVYIVEERRKKYAHDKYNAHNKIILQCYSIIKVICMTLSLKVQSAHLQVLLRSMHHAVLVL